MPPPSKLNSSPLASLLLRCFTLIIAGGIFFPSLIAHDIASVVDNFIVGTPKVMCGEAEVALDVVTAKPFVGNIFVKGRAKDTSCRQSFSDAAQTNASSAYTLSLGKCGMQRLRSANPRGISFAVTVVVSFHPAGFITKNDRAFHLSCFYTEPDEIVTSSFEVSQLPTQELSDQMHMPTCQYSVHRGTVDGAELSWANVGDIVYHLWECKGPEMGLLIKKCFVTDGDGEDHAVVDEDGCSLDHSLLSEVIYEKDAMRAHAKSQVFKYADSNQLFFTCQIRMCQKQMDMCQGVTPPKCDGPKKHDAGGKKHHHHQKKGGDKGKHNNLANLDQSAESQWNVEGGGDAGGGLLGLLDNETATVAATTVETVTKTTVAMTSTDPTTTLPGSNSSSLSLKKMRILDVAEDEEEEDGAEVKEDWTLKRKSSNFNRKSRSLLAAGGMDPSRMEVDVASPQMLVLDRETGDPRFDESSQESSSSPTTTIFSASSSAVSGTAPTPGSPRGVVHALRQSLPAAASSSPPASPPPANVCLPRGHLLLLLLPGFIGLLVGAASALAMCALCVRRRARAQSGAKGGADWGTAMFL